MVITLFIITAALYAISGSLFLIHLSRGGESLEQLAARTLLLAVLSHTTFLICDYALAGHMPLGNIYRMLAVLSLFISLGYLARMRRGRLPSLGAFITPMTLIFFLGAGLGGSGADIPVSVRTALLYIHISASMLGTVLFALAFAVALGYVIQERLLRSRRISGLFQRLPALDVLDTLGMRLITIGFPLFTLGIAVGSIWAVRLRGGAYVMAAPHGFALLAWFFFAGVLLARVTVGWRGRRAAIGTVLGFLCAVITLAGYLLRRAGGI